MKQRKRVNGWLEVVAEEIKWNKTETEKENYKRINYLNEIKKKEKKNLYLVSKQKEKWWKK